MSYPEKVIIIQPPLVQLNTPYPSGAYLSAFFKRVLPNECSAENTVPVVWHDLSIALFHRIFSREGLTTLFAKTSRRALELASAAEENGDDGTAFNLRRYVSSAPLWTAWIDDIVDMLCSGSREKAHEFVRSAHVPRGERMERFLSELGRDVSVDDERMLASLALADLADYITAVFDENFALIRYAESLSASSATFAEIAEAADSPVMRTFYMPLLREVLADAAACAFEADVAQEGSEALSRPAGACAFAADAAQSGMDVLSRQGGACAFEADAAQEGMDMLTRQGAGSAFTGDNLQEGPEALSRHSAACAFAADAAQEGIDVLSRQGAACAFAADVAQEGMEALLRQGGACAFAANNLQEGPEALSRHSAACAFKADAVQEGRELLSRQGGACAFAADAAQSGMDVLFRQGGACAFEADAAQEGSEALTRPAGACAFAADAAQEGMELLTRQGAGSAFTGDNLQEGLEALTRQGAACAFAANNLQEGMEALSRQGGACAFAADAAQEGSEPLLRHSAAPAGKKLFLVTVPFAGCFAAALATCREIKRQFGDGAVVCMGGGYVNTALRGTHEASLSEYVDFLSFDRGYAFYLDLLSAGPDAVKADAALKTNGALSTDMALPADSFGSGSCTHSEEGAVNPPSDAKIGTARVFSGGKVTNYLPSAESFAQEEILTRTIIPDYSGIDFSAYPRVADDVNPMHRIWSDGAWLKAYLAHGCYWHRCAFCDTQLDYVCNYRLVGAAELHEGLSRQAEDKGVYGVHFVDEAAPPAALKEFAHANLAGNGRRLSFWGNIRFEKAFTRDAADFLAYGGLTGVSGGIEIASGEGLTDINKGIDIDSLVGACAAFKEAGVLVHAYMIYGFYNETPQMLIDSAETLRQLFAAGLIDSAFWHKFTLTKHSTVYREWLEGKHPELRPCGADGCALSPVDEASSDTKAYAASRAERAFAEYELHFAGEEKSEKYGAPLMAALDAWMHGRSLNKSIQKWFPFSMPSPKVSADFIDKAIARYEKRRDAAFAETLPASVDEMKKAFVWLGGKPAVLASKNGTQLCWTYMGELVYADVPGVPEAGKSAAGPAGSKKAASTEKAAPAEKAARALAEEAAELLWALRPEARAEKAEGAVAGVASPEKAVSAFKAAGAEMRAVLQQARGSGLCRI